MLTRDGGRGVARREGVFIGLRGRESVVGLAPGLVPTDGVRRLPNPGLGRDVVVVWGEPSRGREGRLNCGRGTVAPGPTDLLKFTVALRVGVGVGGVPTRFVIYLLLLMGTKMPDPGTDVAKYLFPSTSPLFFPRSACSPANSTPANRPGLPATGPRYLTVPYMPPGTFTRSPIWMSSTGGIIVDWVPAKSTGGRQGREKSRACFRLPFSVLFSRSPLSCER